jgi:hypothetical protein
MCVCVCVGNQRSRGVVIARLRLICLEPSSSLSRSPLIGLPLPLRRLGTSLSSSGIRFQVAHEVLSYAF